MFELYVYTNAIFLYNIGYIHSFQETSKKLLENIYQIVKWSLTRNERNLV